MVAMILIVYLLLNIRHYSSIKILFNNYDVFILELCCYCVQFCQFTIRTAYRTYFLVSYICITLTLLLLVCDYDVLQCKHVHVLNPHSLICYACP